jgi:phospholipid/cholesterol/gamma-HCH transport system ATP-binding protein
MQHIKAIPSEQVISIKNLYKAFGDNQVLRGINLEVEKGENLVLLGRSGTGKSVLIKIICGMLTQDEGQVNVMGQEVIDLDRNQLRELRLKVGFSFQENALYDSMTVRENLQFPLVHNFRRYTKKEINREVEMILDAIGLPQTIDQMPAELSGGQKKRIGIGRTLILQPEIVLYDEPTSGLDPVSSVGINSLIKRAKEDFKVSSILITHDLTCAKTTGDQVAMLLEGQVIKQGTFNEIFDTDDKRLKDFYDYNFIQ